MKNDFERELFLIKNNEKDDINDNSNEIEDDVSDDEDDIFEREYIEKHIHNEHIIS